MDENQRGINDIILNKIRLCAIYKAFSQPFFSEVRISILEYVHKYPNARLAQNLETIFYSTLEKFTHELWLTYPVNIPHGLIKSELEPGISEAIENTKVFLRLLEAFIFYAICRENFSREYDCGHTNYEHRLVLFSLHEEITSLLKRVELDKLVLS